jgi:hypothetical protein
MNTCTRWGLALGAGLALTIGPVAATAGAGGASASTVRPAAARLAAPEPPADFAARLDAAAARFRIDVPAQDAVERAIDPDDHECGPTDLDTYVEMLLAGLTPLQQQFVFQSGVLAFPTYDALIGGTNTDPRYALPSDYSQLLTKTFRDVKRFWDIQSADIQLLAMDGSMLLDPARIERVLVLVFEFDPADAQAYAAAVSQVVANTPVFAGGEHPLFTLNAFAFSGEGESDPIFAALPDKLVFGDGVLRALEFMEIGNVGSRVVLGHEFGHHVQYELDLFEPPPATPEGTRRTELMADAYASYFGTHARGLSLNAKRVVDAIAAFYAVGDCAFEDPGHHGTPNQRERAAEWGSELAATARPQGKILPSSTFAQLFDAELPEIVAPDAN